MRVSRRLAKGSIKPVTKSVGPDYGMSAGPIVFFISVTLAALAYFGVI